MKFPDNIRRCWYSLPGGLALIRSLCRKDTTAAVNVPVQSIQAQACAPAVMNGNLSTSSHNGATLNHANESTTFVHASNSTATVQGMPNALWADSVNKVLPGEGKASTHALCMTLMPTTDNLRDSILQSPPSTLSGLSPPTGTVSSQKQPCGNRPLLPDYLEPVPENIPADDLEYLQRKGSFIIPSEKFRNALLRSYAVSTSHAGRQGMYLRLALL